MASTVPGPPRRSVGAEGGGGGDDKACQQLSAAEQRRIQQECLCLVRKLQPRIVFYSTSTPTTPKLKTDVAHVRTLLETKGLSYEEVDLAVDSHRKDDMIRASGKRLLPQVHINGKFLGDADKLQEIEDGNELEKTILDMARSA
eukprot:TRINITY_DN9054_c0_g1_i1.p1 TRINITY_DN9054_c0_g1~~TRINITY_DN9054_c0_g1_i1.p1  ORF type:complete len:144 (-),score=19.17 TRINITY_DN9054_c0_g1_i1:193-624(-)